MKRRSVDIPKGGKTLHLWGFRFVRMFRTVFREGDTKYWATNDLKMTEK